LLRQLTQEAYPYFLTELDPTNATYAQMEEKLKEHFQIAADVGRKCIKFYIGLAQDGSIALSPFVTRKSRAVHTSSANKKIKRIAARATETTVESGADPPPPSNEQLAFPASPPVQSLGQMLMSKFPDFDPLWTDEVKLRWFQAFDELIQKFPGVKR